MRTDPAAILRMFASLEPPERAPTYDVTANGPFLWLRTRWSLILSGHEAFANDPLPRHDRLQRLASIDALHRDERLLREGFVFLCGPTEIGGSTVRVCLPLLSQPVRIQGTSLVSAGEVRSVVPASRSRDRRDLETIPIQARGLAGKAHPTQEAINNLYAVRRWIRSLATAAGYPEPEMVSPDNHPVEMRDGDRFVAVVGAGLFVARDLQDVTSFESLMSWSKKSGLDRTAFRSVYDGTPGSSSRDASDDTLMVPLPLSVPQRQIVVRARTERLTAVSGPPGNGKSHALVATALDAVARGERVLVATKSDQALAVLGRLFTRYPGPTPVLFGDAEDREAITERLASSVSGMLDQKKGEVARGRLTAALADRRSLELALAALLHGVPVSRAVQPEEVALGETPTRPRWQPPVLRGGASERERVTTLLVEASEEPTSMIGRRRQRRSERRLRSALGAPVDVSLLDLGLAVAQAYDRSDISDGSNEGVDDLWVRLCTADEAVLEATGGLIDARSRAWIERKKPRQQVVALVEALRATRSERRAMLAKLDSGALLEALPLWVGTLADIEDLLPARPGLFDLVLLDEAAQIDQPSAAPALLRAKRAVVAGDACQLRHVSFQSDATIAAAAEAQGLAGLADRLDLRRTSALDLAFSATPVSLLSEHYRSSPHLIEFSARRFYGGGLQLMTRHPSNEHADLIEVRRLDTATPLAEPAWNAGSAVGVEVEAIERELKRLAKEGVDSVGVITPFRVQAETIESMLLHRFTTREIEGMDLAVGTVHRFQGGERDVMIISLGLRDADPPGRWRFVQDPNLFNVMVTRARQRIVVVTAITDPPRGLVADYLRHADQPPAAPVGTTSEGWTSELASALREAGVEVRAGYPVGHWTIDLCVGEGRHAVAVECGRHAQGVEAHLARRRALGQAGWSTRSVFPADFEGDAEQAAADLALDLATVPQWAPAGQVGATNERQ